jgi:heat-inducible transcriptional repressor
MNASLSERQRAILRRIIEEYIANGQPVGSRTLVERAGFDVSSSTVRAELADLERRGLLTHPRSAGRIPTETGYHTHIDGLLAVRSRATKTCRWESPRRGRRSRRRYRRRPRSSHS